MASRADTSLTAGQMICLELVARNLTSKEIAARLGISPHTVDQRVRRALPKLGAHNRRQAARLVSSMHQSSRIKVALSDQPPASNDARIVARLTDIPLPFATPHRPANKMGVTMRLFWIAMIAVASFLSVAMYMAGLKSLSRLLLS
jgi:DNA-binding CsgD family transcriptional regulator